MRIGSTSPSIFQEALKYAVRSGKRNHGALSRSGKVGSTFAPLLDAAIRKVERDLNFKAQHGLVKTLVKDGKVVEPQ